MSKGSPKVRPISWKKNVRRPSRRAFPPRVFALTNRSVKEAIEHIVSLVTAINFVARTVTGRRVTLEIAPRTDVTGAVGDAFIYISMKREAQSRREYRNGRAMLHTRGPEEKEKMLSAYRKTWHKITDKTRARILE